MKTILRVLAASALLLSISPALQAIALPVASHATTTTTFALSYEQGMADGADEEANYASAYGRGTQEYQDAIDAAVQRATYNARNSEEPIYWRGYVNGLQY
ncbi:hypothetical protein [Hymenobacter wooponensis]|uniref:DUF4148 domain-containing protein n=1 Tax=Hymenobacter wooponensis TaxID=1525360 RepID=A0A4Z0ML46_9BACT|nr:hypothetical protein [Hymenobacter wooponensis]TGD80281.1 hypothetical protein EU557_10575 [Hymenobacter wooponensis]